MKIETTLKFHAAHVLNLSYKSMCSRPHGHTWKVEIEIDNNELNDDGMIVDFGMVKGTVMALFDHKFLINKEDTFNKDIIKFLTKTYGKECLCLLEFNPTAENLANFIKEVIEKIVEDATITVRVWETENNMAETD